MTARYGRFFVGMIVSSVFEGCLQTAPNAATARSAPKLLFVQFVLCSYVHLESTQVTLRVLELIVGHQPRLKRIVMGVSKSSRFVPHIAIYDS